MIPDDVPLIGRERELSVLRAAVVEASSGRPSAVLVAAEAGGGKTRLVRALLEGTTGSLVLPAQCVDLGDPGLPYLTVVDLVRSLRAAAATDPDLAAVLVVVSDPNETFVLCALVDNETSVFHPTLTVQTVARGGTFG